jgi:hypothetical protein
MMPHEHLVHRPTPRQTSRLPRPDAHETEQYRHQSVVVRCTECDNRITDENPYLGIGCSDCSEGAGWE